MWEPIASGSTGGLQGRQALSFIANLSMVCDVKVYDSSSQLLNVPVGVNDANVQRVATTKIFFYLRARVILDIFSCFSSYRESTESRMDIYLAKRLSQ